MSASAIIHGDGIARLLGLRAGSVALVLTDPPWGATRAAWDRPLDWSAWWAAIDHALAADGTLVVSASIKLAMAWGAIARRPFAYDLVWRKNRSTGHLNAKRAPMRAHETLLVFGATSYSPQFTVGHRPMNAATRRSRSSLYGTERTTSSQAGTTRRYATSVLDFPVLPNIGGRRLHPTEKPVDLMRWIVRAYTKPGDVVADPTCGSGAAVRAAVDEGRIGVGWDINETFAADARARLAGGGDLFTRRTA